MFVKITASLVGKDNQNIYIKMRLNKNKNASNAKARNYITKTTVNQIKNNRRWRKTHLFGES